MIVGYPSLGARWSDFFGAEAPYQTRMSFVASDGQTYCVLSDDTIPTTRVRRLPSLANVYSFPALGGIYYNVPHLVPIAHGDWIYQCKVGRSSSSMLLGLYAYNPVTGTVVTIKTITQALSNTLYSTTSGQGFSDVSVDPVTGIGLAYMGWDLTYTYVVHHAGGGPVEPWDEYLSTTERGHYLCTFDAGDGSTSPTWREALVSSGPTSGSITPYGLACAWNDVGLYYDAVAGTYKRVASITAGGAGSNLITGTTPLSLITGPNLFRDSDSATTIHDSEGNTWSLSGIGTGLTTYGDLDIIGNTATAWIAALLYLDSGGVATAILSLAKAGTTVALLDTIETEYGSAYFQAWNHYLAGRQSFLGATGYEFPTAGRIRVRKLITAALDLPSRELS